MKSYTPVYRFGHMLLVPTSDWAGARQTLSHRQRRCSPTTSRRPRLAKSPRCTATHTSTIKGLSGNVKKVYSADKAILQFGHLRQENQDMVAV